MNQGFMQGGIQISNLVLKSERKYGAMGPKVHNNTIAANVEKKKYKSNSTLTS